MRGQVVRSAPVGVAAGALVGCAYLALNDPNDPGTVLPACPFRALTGLLCPLCGGLRMTRALLYGDLGGAVRANALLVAALPLLALGWLLWLRQVMRGSPTGLRLPRGATAALLATALGWTVVRNLT